MQIFKQISDIFSWLQSTGILAALVALIIVVVKQAQPYLKIHIKNKQINQLTDFALTTVTKFATLAGLSKADRKKAADKDVADFADQLGLTWVTPEIVDSIVEAAYQYFKKLGYDNHAPQTSPEPTEPAEKAATPVQTSASSAAPVAQSSAPKPEGVGNSASQAPQTIQSVANSGSDQNA
ncbi:phage holin, LLH family [Lentilactobacillus diolivorans]|uniref:phage holin, LLH family n=1 Tax=Lentilactobacillus diolivorans TaxID=179838 RepID=UPI0024695D6B|nr:phage holin, LLH family [Lentilactobacillus diolivorans]MDH5107215.1 phage holin, LLH family [Lentilactobacillus diolivorans]